MAIELKDVEHLAGLARLAISDTEKTILKNDLENILEYVSEIKNAVSELEAPTAGPLRNVLRDDAHPHAPEAYTEDLISAAPMREGDRILVKKIL